VRLGLQDFGKLSFDIIRFADAGQNAMRAARAAGARKQYKLEYPNGLVSAFAAFVKSMPHQGGVDAVIAGTAELRIDGDVIVA